MQLVPQVLKALQVRMDRQVRRVLLDHQDFSVRPGRLDLPGPKGFLALRACPAKREGPPGRLGHKAPKVLWDRSARKARKGPRGFPGLPDHRHRRAHSERSERVSVELRTALYECRPKTPLI